MGESLQPSLLAGFDLSAPLPGIANMAQELPVARVVIDSAVPHLDRPFDYLVPADLDEAAQPGVRVKVRVGGQELGGFLTARLGQSRQPASPASPAGVWWTRRSLA